MIIRDVTVGILGGVSVAVLVKVAHCGHAWLVIV